MTTLSPGLQVGDAFAHLRDLAAELMAENNILLARMLLGRGKNIHVRTADRAAVTFDLDIVPVLDLGNRAVLIGEIGGPL